MKTSEFIKKVKELGYDIKISGEDVIIKHDGCIFAMISRTSPYTMSTYTAFKVKHADELLDLCVEYVKTPIEEREEEEKFYLRKKHKAFYEYSEYLNRHTGISSYCLNTNYDSAIWKAQFTQKEIDEIKERFNTDLEEFEQIEVEE